MSIKNNKIVSGLKLGLGEIFSKFETLEVEFETFIRPGSFGFLGGLSFREIVTQQLEYVDRSLKALVGFLDRSKLSLRSAGANGWNHRCYRGFPEMRGPFCKTVAVQHNVRFQILKTTSFVTELIEVRLEVVPRNLRVFNDTECE